MVHAFDSLFAQENRVAYFSERCKLFLDFRLYDFFISRYLNASCKLCLSWEIGRRGAPSKFVFLFVISEFSIFIFEYIAFGPLQYSVFQNCFANRSVNDLNQSSLYSSSNASESSRFLPAFSISNSFRNWLTASRALSGITPACRSSINRCALTSVSKYLSSHAGFNRG